MPSMVSMPLGGVSLQIFFSLLVAPKHRRIYRRWYNESRAGLCSPFFNFHFDGAETNSNVDRDWFAECPFGYRILCSCWAHE
jgi:hypothetical protein